MLRIVAAVSLVLMLGGCYSGGTGPREGIGALGGAVGGAFLGEKVGKGRGRVLATAAGTVLGAAVGSDVGRSLDRANRAYESLARRPTGHSQQTPVPGFAPPPRAGDGGYQGGAGQAAGTTIRDAQDCRALEGGGLRPAFACRNSVGQWFVIQ